MKESNNNQEISIKIQTLDNTYPFKINPSFTILQLKEEISKKYKIPIDRQRLIFQGKFLKENEKLSFYKITDGCVVQLIAKSLEENNNNSNQSSNNQNNGRFNEVYPIIQIPFRTNRRRRRVVMPHFDISEYFEGFYQNLISIDNYNKCKTNFNYNNNNIIDVFDFSKSTYEVGEWVDVKDTINQWLEAQVIKVQNNKAYVHYNGWGTRWDEWIEFSSPRMRNFKTFTLQTPLSFSVSPYPAIPCDSNIEPQERPVDIFYYVEKTKIHLENLLDEMNKLLNLRKKSNSLFKDDKFSKENYEILFKATQMIPFLDRIGRMLSDISLVFSHFMVNPNLYSSFLFGYKRQDLFNEVFNMKKNKNDIFDNKNDINEIKNTENKDTQTPPLENKFLKNIQSQSQKTKQTEKNNSDKNHKTSIINNNSKTSTLKNKENINKIEDKKDKKDKNINIHINNNEKDISKNDKDNKNKEDIKIIENNHINGDKDKDKGKDKNKNEDKNKNDKIKENINNNEENPNLYHRHNSYTAPSSNEEEENLNTANFQRQRQRINQEEILPNQISTNLGYDLSFSSIELPFVQRIIYSYTRSDRIISPSSPFYQVFSNKKLFPRVNLQVPTMLPPGEVIMMTGYSPFPESNFDIYIHTISVNPNNRNENEGNNNNENNNRNNNENNNIIRNINNIVNNTSNSNPNNNPNNNTIVNQNGQNNEDEDKK